MSCCASPNAARLPARRPPGNVPARHQQGVGVAASAGNAAEPRTAGPGPAPGDALWAELQPMRVADLRRRAAALGVSGVEVDSADDADSPKVALIELILRHEAPSGEARPPAAAVPGSAAAALRQELVGLKLKDLRARAKEAGMSAEQLDSAMDSDDPEEGVISFLLEHAQHTPAAVAQNEVALLSELHGLRLKELRKRAKAARVEPVKLDSAMDQDEPEAALIELLVTASRVSADSADTPRFDADVEQGSAATPPGTKRAVTEGERGMKLRKELEGLRLTSLQRKAAEGGIGDGQIDDALDSRDAKSALIELLLVAKPRTDTAELAADARNRPHFGNAPHATAAATKQSSGKPHTKHVMLSYQWDHQSQVSRAHETLTRLGIKCWMDISGGMGADIYESMAEGVSNASVVVCFMSEKYQSSTNCMLEAKYAKQCGVDLLPVMMDGSGWRPRGRCSGAR